MCTHTRRHSHKIHTDMRVLWLGKTWQQLLLQYIATSLTRQSHDLPQDVLLRLSTETGIQGDRLGAAIHLLHVRSAVAFLVACLAIELLAARAWVQDVVLVGKGVSPFTRESASHSQMLPPYSRRLAIKEFYLRAKFIWGSVKVRRALLLVEVKGEKENTYSKHSWGSPSKNNQRRAAQ